jgi:hypothetical protein
MLVVTPEDVVLFATPWWNEPVVVAREPLSSHSVSIGRGVLGTCRVRGTGWSGWLRWNRPDALRCAPGL